MLDGLAGKLDRLIGVFSPERAASRRYFREVMAMADKKRIEKYAAAKTHRLTGVWSPANSNVNDIIGASSSTIRGRVRQLVRDFPYFARAVNTIVDWTIGDGIMYQAMIQRPGGDLDTETNQKMEDAFKYWGDEADIAGKLHFYEIMQLAKRQDVESGEFLIVKTRTNRSGRFMPFCLQVYEADWLSSNTIRNVARGNEVEQGIEYNTSTGRVIAYHLTDPDSWGKTKRILAENVIHGFKTTRPGQLRGISSLAPGVLVAHSLHEYMETEIDAAKMAAKYLSFVKTPNPLARQMATVSTDTETGQKLEEIENGIIEYLRPGEEIEIAANPRPGTNFPPFVKMILCMLAVTAEVPYELISGNYEGLNYSVSRSVRNDFAQQLRPIARRHVRQFAMPIMTEFLNEAVMSGKLQLPGYWNDPRAYQRCEWQPPGMESIDPNRETKGHIDAVNNLLRSPQEIARARGRNIEDIYKEIKDAKELAEKYGIEVTAQTSTALANNPAAVENQKMDKTSKVSKVTKLSTRNQPERDMSFRTLSVRLASDGAPATLDTENRSFEVVGATEAPVDVFDYERWEVVPEVLLMDGIEMPAGRQVPMLDSHMRYATASVLGSYRDMKVENDQLVGRVFFSSTAEAESPYTKAREGHLTDFSVGYRVIDSQWVPKGERTNIRGRSFEGPVRVTTRWRVKELSICPIGADEAAKARSDQTKKPKSKKETKMDPRTRAYLESRGLAADATEEQAWAYLEMLRSQPPADGGTTQTATEDDQVDIDQIRSAATGEERERIVSIDAMCRRAQCQDRADEFIRNGTSAEEVRRQLFEHIVNSIENEGGYGHRGPVELGEDAQDKFRAAAEHGMMMRSGMRVEAPAPGATDFRGYSLRELARHSLRMAGRPDGGNAMEMVGRALTTSDLPYILANVANKSLFSGWETADETWNIWCDTGQVTDFKTHSVPRLSESDDLDEIPDKGKYKYGERAEAQEQYAIATYGKLEAVTRHTIINDDLNALTAIPRSHGEAAARKVGDVAYAVLTANANMGDGVALFASGHGNLATSAGVPGTATITAAELAMGTQKDLRQKRRLNIRPQFFVAPFALKGTAEVFFNSERFADSDTVATDSSLAATRKNIYSGDIFTRVYDARLDDVSATAWYMATGKGRQRTVTVFFLDGVQEPYMEMQSGWTVDGVEYKVRIDVGAKAMDWRGLYKNAGA